MPEKDKALEVIDERMPVLDATIEQGSLPDVIEAQAIKSVCKDDTPLHSDRCGI